MVCTLEQRKEAIANEKKSLLELEANGGNIEAASKYINDLEANLTNEVRLKNITKKYEKQFTTIPASTIAKMNTAANNPTTAAGVKLTIVDGYIDANGRAAYNVKYPNGVKTYLMGAHAIVMDNMDAQYSVTDRLGARPDNEGNQPGVNSKADRGKVVIKASEISNVAALEKLVDTLQSIDNIGTSESHTKHLLMVFNHVVGRLKKPMQEMNIYLNDKADSNGGFIEFKDDKGIYLKSGRDVRSLGTDMSMLEIFVHELIHGATHYGLNANKIALTKEIRLLTQLRSKALDILTVDDLMGDSIMNEDAERMVAEGRLAYMTSENGLEEFLAMALSNEKVFNKLKTIKLKEKKKIVTLGDSLLASVMMLVDAVMGTFRKDVKTISGDKLLMKLVSDIGSLNHKAARINDQTLRAKAGRQIDRAEERWKGWIDGLEGKNQEYILNKLAGKKKLTVIDKVRAIHFVLASEKGTPMMQGTLAMLGMREEGFIQSILRHVKHADKYGNKIQKLILAAQQIDTKRESEAANIAGVMNEAFGRKLRKEEKKALYGSAMLADNSTMLKAFSKDELKSIYNNMAILDKAIAGVEVRLSEKLSDSDSRYMLAQAKGLADLMMTGNSTVVQRKNATAIVSHVMKTTKPSADLITDVDLLTSLYATKTIPVATQHTIARLVGTNYDGMKFIAEAQSGFRAYILGVNPEESNNLMKNYHRETYDSGKGLEIAKTDAGTKRRMQLKGYKLTKDKVSSLGLGYGDSADMKLGLYVNHQLSQQPMNRASLRYTGDREPGMSLWQDALKRGMDSATYDVVQAQIKRAADLGLEYEEAVRAGKEPKVGTNVVPVVNAKNEITDYKTQVPYRRKIEYMGLEMDAPQAVARSWAHEADVEESKELNGIVWDTLMDDMIENAHSSGNVGKNQHRYVDISRLSDVNEVKDAVSILPENIRELMNTVRKANVMIKGLNNDLAGGADGAKLKGELSKFDLKNVMYNEGTDKFELGTDLMMKIIGDDKYAGLSETKRSKLKRIFGKNIFKVRRDMLLDIFGVRDASLANILPGHQMTKHLKKAIRMLEDAWKEIVKIFKVDVIIRTLPVIMGNMISNIMYSFQYGLSPLAVAKRQLEGVALLRDYLADTDALAKLIPKLAINPNDKVLQRKKLELEGNINKSAIKPLIDEGLYQHIIEDVNMSDVKSNSKISRYISDKTEGAPQLLKDIGNWTFVSEKTSLFKLVTTMTAYSDFVARYAQYTLGIEKEKQIYQTVNDRPMTANQEAQLAADMIIRVRDAYVNYSKPDSKILQYMNDMGLVAFSKYAIRIQLGIQDLIKGKPLRFGLAILGQEMFEMVSGYNPDDIGEVSVFARPIDKWVYSPGFSKIIGDIIEPQMITNINKAFG